MSSSRFSIAEALELGQFVLAAYAIDIAATALPAGYTLVSRIYADDLSSVDEVNKVFGFIARSDSDVVVAIRGTEGILEWFLDAEVRLIDFPYVDAGMTERGFTNCYTTLRAGPGVTAPRVAEALRDLIADGSVNSLRISGHSLGGALATLLAIEVAATGVFAAPSVYTFASPAVGDKIFAGTFDQWVPDSWRIDNALDIVPKLPPLWAGYVHVDAEVPINSDGATRQTLLCWHELETYLHTLDPTVPLDPQCEIV